MRTISPPLQAIHTLSALLAQPEIEIEAMVKKVASIPVSRSLIDVLDEQAKAQDWNIIASLISLFRHQRALKDQPLTSSPYLDQILTWVKATYQREHSEQPEEGKLTILRNLLQQALSAKFPLGRMLKTNDLQTFNERNFTRIRIVSDMRPVFESDEQVSEPIGAVVVHTMNIVFQKQLTGLYEDIFVVLDTEELQELKFCIDRAIEKSEFLERALEAFETESQKVEGQE